MCLLPREYAHFHDLPAPLNLRPVLLLAVAVEVVIAFECLVGGPDFSPLFLSGPKCENGRFGVNFARGCKKHVQTKLRIGASSSAAFPSFSLVTKHPADRPLHCCTSIPPLTLAGGADLSLEIDSFAIERASERSGKVPSTFGDEPLEGAMDKLGRGKKGVLRFAPQKPLFPRESRVNLADLPAFSTDNIGLRQGISNFTQPSILSFFENADSVAFPL